MRALHADEPRAIGPYRILGLIGSGGMGRVFLAAAPDGRLAAVKLISSSLVGGDEFRTRFAREVDASRRVSGAYTAAVLDADTAADEPWLASVFVAGPDLHAVVGEHGPLPLGTLRRLLVGLARALEGVHGAGLVHRDLKPSNVLLLDDGPRVVDFGIAHVVEAGTRHTLTGTVIGTPGYMAPEQVEGRRPTTATDVFALGAVIAYAATGRPPFGAAGSIESLVYRVMFTDPDLQGVPPPLRGLVAACLAKKPADRPSLREILAAVGPRSPRSAWLPEPVHRMIGRHAADADRLARAVPATAEHLLDAPATGPRPGRGRHTPTPAPRGRPRWRRRLALVTAIVVLVPLLAFVAAYAVLDLPGEDIRVAQVATLTFADGSPLASVRPRVSGREINRETVDLGQVPEHVRHAVVAAEDPSFFANASSSDGITGQYLAAATGVGEEPSLWEELKLLVLAVKATRAQTKEQILESYLNLAYFGRGAYGIQAGARAYFGKDVQTLTVSEGALLAGIVGSPLQWDPAENPVKATERWNVVLDAMAAQGWLAAGERAGQEFPQWLPEQPQPPPNGDVADHRGHIVALVKAELESHGITESMIETQGLTVTTTIDPVRQQLPVDVVTEVMRGQPENLRTALVSIDPRSGAIVAYYGGANGAGTDYARTLRRPGTSFQPFVLAAALQGGDGVGLGTLYDGSSPQEFPGELRPVQNSEGYACGECSVKTAMSRSINTVFYRMALDVGPARVIDAAHQAGIPEDLLPEARGGVALGDQEVHPVDMALAYATFAADGRRHTPHLVATVTAADGRVLYAATADPEPGEQAMPQQVARNVTEAMLDDAGLGGFGLPDRPAAVKAGTVPAAEPGQTTDAWTVGFTPSLSTGVWVGTDNELPIRTSTGQSVVGATLPGPIWQQFMTDALRGTRVEQFSRFVPLGDPPVGAG